RRSLRLCEEAEVQAEQEEDEIRNGTPAIDFRGEDKACAQERHRHLRQVKIELNSCADKECSCQKLANLPASIRKIQCQQARHDDCCYEKCEHRVLLLPLGPLTIYSANVRFPPITATNDPLRLSSCQLQPSP